MAKVRVEKAERIVADAYHGTELSVAERILAGEGFQIRPDPEDDPYLGDGVYFYEGFLEPAERHARDRRKYKDYAVLLATVRLGKCLDLYAEKYVSELQFRQ